MNAIDAARALLTGHRLSYDAADPLGRPCSVWAEHDDGRHEYAVRMVRYSRALGLGADEAIAETQALLYQGPSVDRAAEVMLRGWCGERVDVTAGANASAATGTQKGTR